MNGNKASLLGVFVVALGAVFVGGIYVGQNQLAESEKVLTLDNIQGDVLTAQIGSTGEKFDFTPYWRVWNTLERKFIPFGTSTAEEIPAEDRVYRSIEGLVASYNDPYTVFMRPQVSEDFKIATKGSLEGIGAVIGERDGGLVVVGPLAGSPAESAGLVSGDKILKIDGVETGGMLVDDAVKLIRGEGGTQVVLSIQSEVQEPRDVSIVRGTIEIPSTAHTVIEREVPVIAVASTIATSDGTPVSSEPSLEPIETEVQDFYILQLFSFSQTSIASFERELMSFVESGAPSLILDLRGNPGGYIESAIQIASWFLPEGAVVVREYSGPEKKEIVHTSHGRMLFKESVPRIAILVDQGSASASEILAGALQEHGVATLIGTNTFGKGSVQELVSITDELSLKVTVARWYTPDGVSISNGGLTPDIRVDPNSATSSDPWVDAAVDFLASQQ
ncbi:MAG: hypothetical protein UV60_C0003G0012 [Parcubacteria group bacterium GW2011_GWA2_43_11]|nr:MAG: hypothetical protein UU89_C0010G0012 [Parcubacteria group bacterium GW2011_GWC2_42_11]KKS86094.1 MAG: hypothetical protein UV60_C0003G0012 [Parcubacteria group bacterium GW2011_GWA2_43_11]